MTTKPDFSLKVGDRLPVLEAQLINKKTGVPIGDITGLTITFRYKLKSAVAWSTVSTVNVINGPKAIVEVEWGAGDTAQAGDYDMEFRVDFAGKQMTVPNVGCLLLRISEC